MATIQTTLEKAKITVRGLRLLAKIMLTGASLKLTRAAIGEGVSDAEPSSLTALVKEVPSHKTGEEGTSATVDLQTLAATDDTTATMRILIQNGDTEFVLREIGIYAQDPDGSEILYAYTCDKSKYALSFPSNADGAHVSETVDIAFFVSNAENIDANITLPAEMSLAEFTAHKSAAELDHPDGSVTNKKIADGAISQSKLSNDCVAQSKIKDGAVTNNKIGDGAVTLAKLAESVHELRRKLTTDILSIFFGLTVDISIEHNFDVGQDECVIKNVDFMAIRALQDEVVIDYQKEKYSTTSAMRNVCVYITRKEDATNQLLVSMGVGIPTNALAAAPVQNGTIRLV